jgi:hypothetical protein
MNAGLSHLRHLRIGSDYLFMSHERDRMRSVLTTSPHYNRAMKLELEG